MLFSRHSWSIVFFVCTVISFTVVVAFLFLSASDMTNLRFWWHGLILTSVCSSSYVPSLHFPCEVHCSFPFVSSFTGTGILNQAIRHSSTLERSACLGFIFICLSSLRSHLMGNISHSLSLPFNSLDATC